jgi:hypothetical protein
VLTELTPAPEATGDGGQAEHPGGSARHRFRLPDRTDLAIVALYLCGALWVMYHLLHRPGIRVQQANVSDEAVFQFMLAHGARVLSHGVNPFITHQMNVPDGVNLMANTSILGLSIPFAPVTLLLGPAAAYVLLCLFALAGTATSWYYVLSRHLVGSRAGAALGGLFCGFAPGMISHASGHPNFIAQFLVPLLIWRSIRLREPGRALRNGAVLGLLVTWQAFINEEILLMTALGTGLFLGLFALFRRGALAGAGRPGLRGLLVTAAVAGALLAYPLYVQFFGPQSYRGLIEAVRGYGADLESFTAFATQSLGGSGHARTHLAQNPSEENSFLGWPLVVVLLALVWWLRREAAVRALALVGLAFAVLSLGPRLLVGGEHTGVPAPFALLNDLPLLDTLLPTRLALGIIPVVGILLAVGTERAAALRLPEPAAPVRLLWYALLAAALLPVAPWPVPAVTTRAVPAFVSSGGWHRYVPPGRSLVTVPAASSKYTQPMFWTSTTGLDLPIARGYFLGPGPAAAGAGALYGAPPRPTSTLWDRVYATGEAPPIDQRERAAALADLRYWRAGAVVLEPTVRNHTQLWAATSQLLGFTPTLTGGLWVWDVRALVG